MKTAERLKKRLRRDRPMATQLGFSGYQPLMRAYIGQGLRKDLARLENSPLESLTESLRKHGVKDAVISRILSDAKLRSA